MVRNFNKNKREELKHKCLNYLGGKKCHHCKTDYLPLSCYDFHHKQPTFKEEEISKMVGRGAKRSKLKEELDECIILCKNSHALIHSDLNIEDVVPEFGGSK